MPGARHDVILTAGHNLIHETKQPYGDIQVTFMDTASRQIVERAVPVDSVHVHICSTYKENPTLSVTASEAPNDYGAIILEREAGRPAHPSFGWSAILGDEKVIEGEVGVTGYQAGVGGAIASTSTGFCAEYIVTPNQLEYEAQTEEGISGAPVWIGYKGLMVALAVQ
jgi:V8-like Glu-specific endopeptidase